jgi:hypothetical protein
MHIHSALVCALEDASALASCRNEVAVQRARTCWQMMDVRGAVAAMRGNSGRRPYDRAGTGARTCPDSLLPLLDILHSTPKTVYRWIR